MKNLFARKPSRPADFDRTWGEVTSPDGRHTAFRAQRGRQFFVVVDQVCGKAYENSGVNPPVFSPDSQRIAFSMKQNGKQFIILDNKEGPKLDEIVDGPGMVQSGTTPQIREQKGIVFSPDSQRLAYAGWVGKSAVLVVDGQISQPYDQIGMVGLFFSPDSQHLAYAAKKGKNWCVVVDSKQGYDYEAVGNTGLTFSDENTVVTFRASLNGAWRTVKQPVR